MNDCVKCAFMRRTDPTSTCLNCRALSHAEPYKNLLLMFLKHNKTAVHPGRGKADAKLVREVCEMLSLNEDDYLQSFVVRDKPQWGL